MPGSSRSGVVSEHTEYLSETKDEDPLLQIPDAQTALEIVQPVRRYKVWPGRNIFCCRGRLMTSQYHKANMCSTLFVICLVHALFWAFDVRWLIHEKGWIGWLILGLSVSGFIIDITLFFVTGCSDPGIVPRASEAEKVKLEKLCKQEEFRLGNTDFNPRRGHIPGYRIIVVNGVGVKLKYCYTCKIYRPPRTSHCGMCDNCVHRFDHHCPWVGNCIGQRNYRYFLSFLLVLTFLTCLTLFSSIANIIILRMHYGWQSALHKSPGSFFTIFVCILSTLHEYTTLRMTIYHMELASQNLTTHEDIAEVFMVRKSDKSKEFYLDNPYDLGSWTKNLIQLFCGRRTKGLVDSRTFVDPFTPMENKPKYPRHIANYTSANRVFKETIAYQDYEQMEQARSGGSER